MTYLSRIELCFKNLYPQFCKKDGSPMQPQFDIFRKGVETAILTLEHFRDEADYKKYKEGD